MSKNRELIAVDADEVLASLVDVVNEFNNAIYGTHLTREDYKVPGLQRGYFAQVLGVTDEEMSERLRRLHREGWADDQKVMDGAEEATTELRRDYDLAIVTNRSPLSLDRTYEWVDRHLPNTFRDIHFTALWRDDGELATKAEVCRDIGADYLIDDYVEHCNPAAEASIQPLLFGEYGWNIGEDLHPKVVRVAGWSAVREFFDGRT
jgi:5'(3')-deoxyribonucleotidase